jgi:meiotic recombination protein REC8, fungi type
MYVFLPYGDMLTFSSAKDIEIGRRAPESLQGDHSSQMPWNVSASRHGSGYLFGSGLPGGLGSNVGGQGMGMEFGPPSALTSRRGTRLTSASPLLGKGGTIRRYSSLGLPEQVKLAGGEAGGGSFDDSGMQLGGDDIIDDPEFQLYGPAAAVDTQTAVQSQWVAAALDMEVHNFLVFLTAEVNAKIVVAEGTADRLEEDDVETVTFQSLLPPEQHSKVVAAQGLLHVLSLATKGLIEVKQEEAFGRIEIGVVGGEEENVNSKEDDADG